MYKTPGCLFSHRNFYVNQFSDFSTRATFRRLLPYISPYKKGLFAASLALIVSAATDAGLLSLLKPLMNGIGFGSVTPESLRWLPLAVIALVALRGVTGYVSDYCMAWVSGRVVMSMRRQIFSHLMGMPVSYHNRHSSGSLLTKITYDSERVASASSDTLVSLVRNSASVIALMVLMVWNSWQLSIVLLVVAPVIALSVRAVSGRFRRISQDLQKTMGSVAVSAEQMLRNHREVRMYGGQMTEQTRFADVSNLMRKHGLRMVSVAALTDPFIQMIASMALAAVLFAASFPSVLETLSAGSVTVVFSAMFMIMRPLKSLTGLNAGFQQGMTACHSLFSLLDTAQERDEGTLSAEGVRGELEFRNVSFRYENSEDYALRNVSFRVPAGKTVALVGRSGSGKSTLVSLLPRFYDDYDGEILLDGHEIRSYQLKSLREKISLVSQHVHLFDASLADNIAYASSENTSRADISTAATEAYADIFIDKLPEGLDTMAGENGVQLSGGQRQRIAIARALLKKTPLLILDEATSALDNESEHAIKMSLENFRHECTVLIIAHRLSTIEACDEIIVMDDGQISERGSHESLLQQSGMYSKLHDMQFTAQK